MIAVLLGILKCSARYAEEQYDALATIVDTSNTKSSSWLFLGRSTVEIPEKVVTFLREQESLKEAGENTTMLEERIDAKPKVRFQFNLADTYS